MYPFYHARLVFTAAGGSRTYVLCSFGPYVTVRCSSIRRDQEPRRWETSETYPTCRNIISARVYIMCSFGILLESRSVETLYDHGIS